MANPPPSNLSSSTYGYDMVLSTTQVSINATVNRYLSKMIQPPTTLYFLADDNGDVSQTTTLANLLKTPHAKDPFSIPEGTPYNNPAITALTRAKFICAIRIQPGFPEGWLPGEQDAPVLLLCPKPLSPPQFNMYCKTVIIIQNSPSSGFGSSGSWNVYRQPSTPSPPWYLRTNVNLVSEPVSQDLNIPALNNFPAQKQAIQNQLSGAAYSVQQLLVDLDNAAFDSVQGFENIPAGSPAADVLRKSFVNVYAGSAKAQGGFLVAVKALPQVPDTSTLQVTSIEHSISPPIEVTNQTPTSLQQQATTLNYIGMVGNKTPLPQVPFQWDWVNPDEASLGAASGVIAINRNCFANYFLQQLLPLASERCLIVSCQATAGTNSSDPGNLTYNITAGGVPQVAQVTASGPDVVNIQYNCDSVSWASDTDPLLGIQLHTSYTVVVSFIEQNQVEIVQYIKLWVGINKSGGAGSFLIVNRGTDDIYTLTVDDTGNLQLSSPPNVTDENNDQVPDINFMELYPPVTDMITEVRSTLSGFKGTRIPPFPFQTLKSFVFPGANVLSFATPAFSPYQDLTCRITYVDPVSITSSTNAVPQSFAMPVPVQQHEDIAQPVPANVTTADPLPSFKLVPSTGMMQNYIQANLMSDLVKFEALQKSDGHSLIVHIDGDGVLSALNEESGTTSTGWSTKDLSTSFLKANFSSSALVHTFDIGQSALDGTIGVAMVVSAAGKHHLVVSLANSNADMSWIQQMAWKTVPFDDSKGPSAFTISRVFFTETANQKQYLVVDIDASTNSNVKTIARYYVDQSPPSGTQSWVPHTLPFDIEDGAYQSCVGRTYGDDLDAMYTSGTIAGQNQLVYLPLFNEDDPTHLAPPEPTVYTAPGLVTAMTAVRYRDHTTDYNLTDLYGLTDMYVISGSSLYCYPANGAANGVTTGQLQLTDPALAGTHDLRAMMAGDLLVLWGNNSAGDVFYICCAISALPQVTGATNPLPSPWAVSLPILSKIDAISTYVNTTDGGNTIFAYGAGKITHLIQDTQSLSQMWRTHEIKLPAPPALPATPFNSYTTVVRVTDANDKPVNNASLQVSANTRTPCLVNGLYQVLTPSPTTVATDSSGNITVVEAVSAINGTILTFAHQDANTVTVDPQHASFHTLAGLSSGPSLLGASIVTNTVYGGTRGPVQRGPLVPQPAGQQPPQSDVDAVVQNLQNLQTVYSGFTNPSAPTAAVMAANFEPVALGGFFSGIKQAFGDLVQHIKQVVTKVVDVVVQITAKIVQDANNVWQFVATIGGQVYSAAVNDVHAAVGALEWVYDRVKTAVTDLIRYLELLFNWDNIERTKKVMHNLTTIYLKDITSDFTQAKQDFDSLIATAESDINTWAGIKDWSPLGNTSANPAKSNQSDPNQNQTSNSTLLSHHFQNQYTNINPSTLSSSADPTTDVMTDLWNAVTQESAVLSAAMKQFKELAQDIFTIPDLGTLIQRVAAIFADGVLSSVRVIFDAVFDVLAAVGDAFLDILNTPIHVPIISDLLSNIGIPPISFLDLFTWIAAVGYTVVYELANDGNPPFPDTDQVNQLINATDMSSLLTTSQPTAQAESMMVSRGKPKGSIATDHRTKTTSLTASAIPSIPSIDPKIGNIIFQAFHSGTAILTLVKTLIVPTEATFTTADNPLSTMAMVLGGATAVLPVVADVLCPKYPIADPRVALFKKGISGSAIAFKLFYSSRVAKLRGVDPNAARTFGAMVAANMCIPKMFCSGWHFYELSSVSASDDRAAAIIGEVSNLVDDSAKMVYSDAVNDPDEESRAATCVILAANYLAIAGLEMAEAIVD